MPRRERGSVLLLFPAAVLIVLVLGAIAVDLSIAYLGQRELANSVSGAANDAAAESISNRGFYEGGRLELDADTAVSVAAASVRRALDPARYHDLAVHVVVEEGRCVAVSATASVDPIFARALPGAPHRIRVHATSVASPRTGPAGAAGACSP